MTLRLNYTAGPYFAPYDVASAKGFYAEQGLDVEIREGKGSGPAAQLVGSGDSMFGEIEANILVQSIASGLPIKSVALSVDKTSIGYLFAKDKNINTPKDMEGKTFGAAPGAGGARIWPAFAAANGVDTNKVKIVSVDIAQTYPLLQADKFDFTHTTVGDDFLVSKSAGRPFVFMGVAQHNIDIPGFAIVANKSVMEQRPDTVRRFIAGSVKGSEYVKTHIPEAVDIIVKLNPQAKLDQDRDYMEYVLKAYVNYLAPRVGPQTEKQWQSAIDLLVRYSDLKNAPKATDIFTNDFLPGS